jgi:Uma2 family endonuclease
VGNAELWIEFFNRKPFIQEREPHSRIQSTTFKLPGGGDRSPDAAWVELSRWEDLTPEQHQKFPLIAPDLVIELRSCTDNLQTLQEKMQEYMDSVVKLG